MTVAELRHLTGLDQRSNALHAADPFFFIAWTAVSAVIALAPLAVALAVIRIIAAYVWS